MEYSKLFKEEQELWKSWHAKDYLGNNFEEGLRGLLYHSGYAKSLFVKMKISSDCTLRFFDINSIPNLKDWEILEIGCGFGLLGVPFIGKVKSYKGVDIALNLIEKANQAWKNIGIDNVSLFAVDERGLDIFPDNSFDFIFAENVFIHTPPTITRKYLEQISKKLKNNGRFLFEFNMKYDGSGVHRNTTESYTPQELDELFKNSGLKIVQTIEEVEYFLPNQKGRHIFGGRI